MDRSIYDEKSLRMYDNGYDKGFLHGLLTMLVISALVYGGLFLL